MFNVWYWVVDGATDKVYAGATQTLVDVTDETYTAWLDKGNRPTKIDSINHIIAPVAQAALDASDRVVIRCYSAGTAVPSEWQSYRNALRAIQNGSDTTSTALPTAPAYHANT